MMNTMMNCYSKELPKQMSEYVSIPKRGSKNPFQKVQNGYQLSQIQIKTPFILMPVKGPSFIIETRHKSERFSLNTQKGIKYDNFSTRLLSVKEKLRDKFVDVDEYQNIFSKTIQELKSFDELFEKLSNLNENQLYDFIKDAVNVKLLQETFEKLDNVEKNMFKNGAMRETRFD